MEVAQRTSRRVKASAPRASVGASETRGGERFLRRGDSIWLGFGRMVKNGARSTACSLDCLRAFQDLQGSSHGDGPISRQKKRGMATRTTIRAEQSNGIPLRVSLG